MNKPRSLEASRRQFIKWVPACAATCFGCAVTPASAAPGSGASWMEGDGHKFDQPFDRELSFKQLFAVQFRGTIGLSKALAEDLGKEKTIELLKKYTTARMLKQGREQAKRAPDGRLGTYVAMFKEPNRYKNTLTMEIVEDTDAAFELKVTECLWATTFLDADAGDIGYASVCYGDYAWAEGFNPEIKLVRDKTLMEGAPYCNHRYIWQPKSS